MSDPSAHTSTRGDRIVGWTAYASAVVGVLGIVFLALMYAILLSGGGMTVFGRLSDFTGGVYFAVTIPVIMRVHKGLGARLWSRVGLVIVVATSAAACVASMLLVFTVISDAASAPFTVTGIFVQAGWAAIANHRLLRGSDYPRLVGRFGRASGLAIIVGAVLAGVGLVALGVPVLGYVLIAAGGVLGLLGYLAWPIWFALVGRWLMALAGVRGPHPAPPEIPEGV